MPGSCTQDSDVDEIVFGVDIDQSNSPEKKAEAEMKRKMFAGAAGLSMERVAAGPGTRQVLGFTNQAVVDDVVFGHDIDGSEVSIPQHQLEMFQVSPAAN